MLKTPFLVLAEGCNSLIQLCFSGGASGQELACQSWRLKRCGFDPWVRKIPWRRTWQLTPVFFPGESLWTAGPGRLQSMGSQRVRHDCSSLAHVWRVVCFYVQIGMSSFWLLILVSFLLFNVLSHLARFVWSHQFLIMFVSAVHLWMASSSRLQISVASSQEVKALPSLLSVSFSYHSFEDSRINIRVTVVSPRRSSDNVWTSLSAAELRNSVVLRLQRENQAGGL